MKLSLVDGSPPRSEDVNSLVTLTVTSYMSIDNSKKKLDLSIPQSGIIPFSLSLSERNSTSIMLAVRNNFCLLVPLLAFLMCLFL